MKHKNNKTKLQVHIRKIIQEKLWDLKEIQIANFVKHTFNNIHKKNHASTTKLEEVVALLVLENIKKIEAEKNELKVCN